MPDDESAYTMEFDEILALLNGPQESFPELRGQAEALMLGKYDEMIHQVAHHMLLLGMVAPTRCDIMQPVLYTMIVFGYILGATGAKLSPDEEGAEPKRIMSGEELGKLLGDLDLNLESDSEEKIE